MDEDSKADLIQMMEMNPKEFVESVHSNAKFERDWKKHWHTGDTKDSTAGDRLSESLRGDESLNLSVAVAGDWVADTPMMDISHGCSNAVGASPRGTRTLGAVGMRVFKVVAPKIAVRSHFTLDSPKVGALVTGDTIVVTESRFASVNPVADGDEEASPGVRVERLHCLGGWVSATSASSGDALVEEEDSAADKQLVSCMQ